MRMMRWSVLLVTLAGTAACGLEAEQPQQPVEMRTINNTPLQPLPPEPSPELDGYIPEVPLPLAQDQPLPADGSEIDPANDTAAMERQMESRAIRLPFAPAIAMDPVDGQKVSITPETPTVEYKGRIYYFNSNANRSTFMAGPDPFLTGALASY